MKLLPVAVALLSLSAPPTAARQQDCSAVIDGADIEVEPRWDDIGSFPTGDRPYYHTGEATVTCQVGERGRLAACSSPLRDERGRWLERQLVRGWKIVDDGSGDCPLIGRTVQFRFFLDMDALRIGTRIKSRIYRWNILDE